MPFWLDLMLMARIRRGSANGARRLAFYPARRRSQAAGT